MPGTDLTARLTGWVQEAIDGAAMGEEYAYTVIPALTQLGTSVYPAWAVMILRRSPLLGGVPLANKLDIPTLVVAGAQQDAVTNAVHTALGNLRKAHAAALQALKTGN
jgi:hypothetical protein